MGFVARLRRGTRIINLNASPFTVAADFVPPSVAETPQVAEGRKRARRTGERRSTQSLSVPVHVEGTTIASIRASVDNANSFLRRAGKRDAPTYFEWRPDNLVSAEAVWGQSGAYRGVEVFWGEFRYGAEYGWWDRSQKIPNCSMNILVGTTIEGAMQGVCSAKGGIVEDWVGASDGSSRGVMVAPADATNGNKVTNPIFGHATYDTGWTATLDLYKNTNSEFILWGVNSARLVADGTVGGTLITSIAAGNTNHHKLSCYVKFQDSSVVTSAVIAFYYDGSPLSTDVFSLGSGWYRLVSEIFHTASAAKDYGVSLSHGYTAYVTGFQLEEKDYVTPFFYGDMLGCSWSGTPHESKSLRAAGTLTNLSSRLVNNNISEGGITVVWQAPEYGSAFATDGYVYYDSTGRFHLFYDQSAGAWVAEINTGADKQTATVADTFAACEILVFDVVWSRTNKLKLYLNGALVATSAAYANAGDTLGTLYFGSDATPANYLGGIIKGVTTRKTAPTAAEVLANYNNMAPLCVGSQSVAAGPAIDPVPYLWTKDGDSVVDYMFTGSYSNIAVIGGVAGSLPAKTEFKAVTAGLNNADVYIGNLDVDYYRFINPEFLTYVGSPDAKTVNTSDTDIAVLSIDDDEFLLLAGRKLALMVRGDEDGSDDISLRTGINPGGAYYYSSYKPSDWIASSTSVSNDLSPELGMLDDEELYRLLGITRAVSIKVQGKRPTGTATFNLHSAQIMPFPMIRLVNTSAAAIATTILYLDGKAREINSAALSYGYSVRGDRDEFGILPGKYNLLVSYLGTEGVATDTSDTLTYSAFYVTPRWALM